MAKVIKKFGIFTYLLLNNRKIVKPIDGGWYDGCQYYKGRLGEPGEVILYE